jgi:hypothetical protein
MQLNKVILWIIYYKNEKKYYKNEKKYYKNEKKYYKNDNIIKNILLSFTTI